MPRPDADRNLLFGILALQMDFVARDSLIAAMNAWALEKHRTIGEILVERGDLEPRFRELLESMVEAHLERHGGDPENSLATLGSTTEHSVTLAHRSMVDAGFLETLAQASQGPNDLQATQNIEPADRLPTAVRAFGPAEARYRKVRDHARGGIGVVFVARDEELNREVALKEIQDYYADDPRSRARFLIEAEITGGLEHPGIVPVYGLGAYRDGRPFYAMRFVRGDSLKDAIAAFHANEGSGKRRGAQTLALQKLLRRFLDVCNAVEYAHSKGVLHRDLKPDNVMLGKFGETLVVDWGLAKVVGRTDEVVVEVPTGSAMIPPPSSGSADTLPGSVIGTPAYMSPEQAAGRLDDLGPASDVYGLGATLYTLLTGQSPFAEKDLARLLRQVEQGEFPRPREKSPWLDPALEAACLKAMAVKPEDRYPSARALADDVERWLADEPVVAHREPWLRRARRFVRKHRTSVTTAASTAAVAILLLAGFAWAWFERSRRAEGEGMTTLASAGMLEARARKSGDPGVWAEAIAEARRAEAQLVSGGGGSGARNVARTRVVQMQEALRDLERDRKILADLDEARLLATKPNLEKKQFDRWTAAEAILAAFRSYGIDLETLPTAEAASQVRSSKVADDLVTAIDEATPYVGQNLSLRLAGVARMADSDARRAEIREMIAKSDFAGLRRLVADPATRRELGVRCRTIFRTLSRSDPTASLATLEAIYRENRGDFTLANSLGVACSEARPPRFESALYYFHAATAIRPNSVGPLINLGYGFLDLGKIDEAIAVGREVVRVQPDYIHAHTALGDFLWAKGDQEGAIACYRRAAAVKPDDAYPHIVLGDSFRLRREFDRSSAEYREATRLDPSAHYARLNLGLVFRDQGRLDDAMTVYREAIRVKPDFSEAHINLGLGLDSQGKAAEALVALREAVRVGPNLSDAHLNLGFILGRRGQLDEAIISLREAARLRPDSPKIEYEIGRVLAYRGELAEAAEAFVWSSRLAPNEPDTHYQLGLALDSLGQQDRAIAAFREATRLNPKHAPAHYQLGLALAEGGQLDQAADAFRQAIQSVPGHHEARFRLGLILKDRGKTEEAIEAFRKANSDYPNYVENLYQLGLALDSLGREDEAIEAFQLAVRPSPDHAEALCQLGRLQQRRGRLALALVNLERGHELGSRDSDWSHPSAGWVEDCRRQVDEQVKLLVDDKGQPLAPARRVALAYLARLRGRHATSARAYDQAFAEQPGLAENLATYSRYNAACSAALAGSGEGVDAPRPEDPARAGFREKALGWLRADLEVRGKAIEGGSAEARQNLVSFLDYWKKDADLISIRDQTNLVRVPEADREAFRSFWADVEALRVKAGRAK